MAEEKKKTNREETDILADIQTILDKVRPYLNSEGGDVAMIDYRDGYVYLRMLGACVGCGYIDSTLYDGIEELLKEYVPEVIGVKNVDDLEEDD